MASCYDAQQINRVLQNNPERYEYKVLKNNVDNESDLNKLEIAYIEKYDPKFNFTLGGEGTRGFKHSTETKNKIRKARTGKMHSDETKKKMSNTHKGKKLSDETKMKMSEAKTGNKNRRKYTLWNSSKCIYYNSHMFKGYRDGSEPCRCFTTKHNGKELPIGMNMDFVSCEIIHDLIVDACKKNSKKRKKCLPGTQTH